MTHKLYTQSDLESLRERCAKACMEIVTKYRVLAKDARDRELPQSDEYYSVRANAAEDCADMIRALPITPHTGEGTPTTSEGGGK